MRYESASSRRSPATTRCRRYPRTIPIRSTRCISRGCARKALAAFARLPEDKRRLILLAYLRDRSRQDLSIRLGIPANTVKTHLRRALLELRATMFASIEARTHSTA